MVGCLLVVVLGSVALGCGKTEEASLCEDYASFLEAGAAVRAIDPSQSTAAEATSVVEDYLESVHRMKASADDRYATELDALASAVKDVRTTLSSVQDTADYATWAPLVKDTLKVAANAAVTVRARIGPTCQPKA